MSDSPSEGATGLADITGVYRIFLDGELDSVSDPSDCHRFGLTARRAAGLGLRRPTLNADMFVEDSNNGVVGSNHKPGTAKEWLKLTLDPGVYFSRMPDSHAGTDPFTLRLYLVIRTTIRRQ